MSTRKLTPAEIKAYAGLAKAARRLREAQERAIQQHQQTAAKFTKQAKGGRRG